MVISQYITYILYYSCLKYIFFVSKYITFFTEFVMTNVLYKTNDTFLHLYKVDPLDVDHATYTIVGNFCKVKNLTLYTDYTF